MNVLIACEFSGRIRDAFRALGHNAVSCDLEPSEAPGPHFQGDAARLLHLDWDMMIAFPPDVPVTESGAKHFAHKEREQLKAVEFFMLLATAPIPRICVTGAPGVMSSAFRPADQIVQPWMFGHGEVKEIALWLKNIPPLVPTRWVRGRGEAAERGVYPGIAEAMAAQWGGRQVGAQAGASEAPEPKILTTFHSTET